MLINITEYSHKIILGKCSKSYSECDDSIKMPSILSWVLIYLLHLSFLSNMTLRYFEFVRESEGSTQAIVAGGVVLSIFCWLMWIYLEGKCRENE